MQIPRLDPDGLAAVATIVDESVAAGSHTGIVCAITDAEGNEWLHVAPGRASLRLDSIIPVASIGKPIVALALMRLLERGKFLLNDAVARYIPGFAENGKAGVTIWHLLTHTSGLTVDEDAYHRLLAERAPREEYLKLFNASPLAFASGTYHQYAAESAFEVLAELISLLSGRPYDLYLRDEVLAPLGMLDTGFAPRDEARAAESGWRGSREDLAYFTTHKSASGGLWTTAHDLLALARALLNGGRQGSYRLLSQPALEVMTRYHTNGIPSSGDGRPSQQALAWTKRGPTGVMLASAASFGHTGFTGGLYWVDPEWGLAFVLLSPDAGEDALHGKLRALNAMYGAITTG
jgi:CubicO group peptidase (beta-lactamase class C family)